MTTSFVRARPGVAGKGTSICSSRAPVWVKWEKISVGIRPVTAEAPPCGFRAMIACFIGTPER